MLRYFVVSLVVAAGLYLTMRFTVGTVVLSDMDPSVAQESHYLLPALVAGFLTAWIARPAVRGQTIATPLFAAVAFPFVAGCLMGGLLAILGRTEAESGDFVSSWEAFFYAVIDAPLYVFGTLPVSIPVSLVAVFALRRSDPPEAMGEKKGNVPALG